MGPPQRGMQRLKPCLQALTQLQLHRSLCTSHQSGSGTDQCSEGSGGGGPVGATLLLLEHQQGTPGAPHAAPPRGLCKAFPSPPKRRGGRAGRVCAPCSRIAPPPPACSPRGSQERRGDPNARSASNQGLQGDGSGYVCSVLPYKATRSWGSSALPCLCNCTKRRGKEEEGKKNPLDANLPEELRRVCTRRQLQQNRGKEKRKKKR